MVHVTRLMQGILYTVNSVKFNLIHIYTVYMVVGGMISRGLYGFIMFYLCADILLFFSGCQSTLGSPKKWLACSTHDQTQKVSGSECVTQVDLVVTALFKSNQYLLHQFLSAMVQHQPRRGFSSWSQDDLVNPAFTDSDGFPSYKSAFSSGISVAILISGK